MNRIETEQKIILNLSMISNRIQQMFASIFDDLTFKQWLLLDTLVRMKEKNPSIIKVAKIFHTSRQNVTKLLLILEKKNYLEIKSSSSDIRSSQIILSKKSFQNFREFNYNLGTIATKLLVDFTDQEIDNALKVILALNNF